MENTSSKVFIIRVDNPLDMEGNPDIESVFFSEEKANAAADHLNSHAVAEAKHNFGDRYRSFAVVYEVQAWDVCDAE